MDSIIILICILIFIYFIQKYQLEKFTNYPPPDYQQQLTTAPDYSKLAKIGEKCDTRFDCRGGNQMSRTPIKCISNICTQTYVSD